MAGLSTVDAQVRADVLDRLGRYHFAVDRGDVAAVLDCFAPGAEVVSPEGTVWRGAEGLRAFAERVTAAHAAGRMHLATPLFVERDGDGVRVHSYLCTMRWEPPAPPQGPETLRYVIDLCVVAGGRWLIASRRISLWNALTVAAGRAAAAGPGSA
jgi:hypothetical protein